MRKAGTPKDAAANCSETHWAGLGKALFAMGPPQVPDAALAARLASLCGGSAGLTVLLGVTPAYAGLGGELRAFDLSPGMIAALWPGDDARRRAEVADWRRLPLAAGSVARVIGDGSLNSLPDSLTLRAVLAEIARIIGQTGRAVIRVFAGRAPAETPDAVFAALRQGRIGSLNVLRWRLAAALADPADGRVAVARILASAESALGPLERFAETRGWDPAEAAHFHRYRGATLCYLFPSRSALAALARDAGLRCGFAETAGYPGAEDCPFAILRA